MQQLVLASGNPGKITELTTLLSPLDMQVVSQSEFDVPEVAETGTTFIENAIIKARHAAEITALPALADDSGLVVDALNGSPGVYSARYAGDAATDEQNVAKLIEALAGVPDHQRTAHFVCVLVLMRHAADPTPIICQGKWQGKIAFAPFGDGGFGYDPIFWAPEGNCCAAQLSKVQKNVFSHRGKALVQLKTELENRHA